MVKNNLTLSNDKKYTSKHTSLVLAFAEMLVFCSLISACRPQNTDPPPLPPTPTPCPLQTPVSSSTSSPILNNKFIVAIVDKSLNYRRNEPGHDYGIESLKLLSDSLSNLASPGDKIFVIWVDEVADNRNGIILDTEIPKITIDANPRIVAPPIYPTPIPALDIPEDAGDIQKEKIREQNLAITHSNDIASNDYYCSVFHYDQDVETGISGYNQKWNAEDRKIMDSFTESIRTSFDIAENEKNAPGRTRIYQSLSIVARKFNDPVNNAKYNKKILLIFSDMVGIYGESATSYNIDISGVDVLVGNFYCPHEYTYCLSKENDLKNQFANSFHSKSIVIKFPFETDDKTMKTFVNGGQ